MTIIARWRARARDGEPPDAITLIFGAIPFTLILGRGGVLTGATGIFPADQLQYLAWIRDLSTHLLAHNSFDLATSKYVFTDPFFALSGVLVRIGLSPALAYLLWLPVAACVLVAGFRAYVRRLLRDRAERIAALVLALFAVTPMAPVLGWLVPLSSEKHNELALAVADSTPALQLWGYFPIAITLALVCACFLALERALDGGTGRVTRGQVAMAAAAAALAAWLHPWQGVTIVVVVIALAAVERSRRTALACAVVAATACLPLVYYYVLPKIDHAWSVGQAQNNLSFTGWIAPAVLVPLAVPAVLGARRPAAGIQERILLIWPLAALAVYLLNPPYSIHALETVSLPLAILAVRGARRFERRSLLATAGIVLLTVPGLAFAVSLLDKAIRQRPSAYALRGDDARAIRLIARSKIKGGVLAPNPIAVAIPGRTGRNTWLGHPTWTPGFGLRDHEASRFFSGQMPAGVARRFVRIVGAGLLLAPCGSSRRLALLLGAEAVAVDTGCARVLMLRR